MPVLTRILTVMAAPLRWTRQLYDWVLGWGESRHGSAALFFLAMAEASFFPVPPDALLIGLCMGAWRKWFRFALVCSLGSLVGGMLGYLIGHWAFDLETWPGPRVEFAIIRARDVWGNATHEALVIPFPRRYLPVVLRRG